MVDVVMCLDDLPCDSRIEYIPTPREIATACAVIRARWTSNELERRQVGAAMRDARPLAWLPPTIDTSTFRAVGSRRVGDLAV